MISTMNAEESYAVLRGGRLARLGCVDDGGPYVVPVNYAFDGESIYVHSLPGRKIQALRADPRACLQVDESRGDFGWRSVIAFGRYEEITRPADRAHAMNLLLSLFPRLTPVESLIAEDVASPAPVVFRLRVERITGVCEG